MKRAKSSAANMLGNPASGVDCHSRHCYSERIYAGRISEDRISASDGWRDLSRSNVLIPYLRDL